MAPARGIESAYRRTLLDREALDAATAAVPSPDDPPEFAARIAALRDPKLPSDERERIMFA
ncbi:MAG: hypothetical protein ACREFJ_09020, partial [Acetobacteraceae bacterium]